MERFFVLTMILMMVGCAKKITDQDLKHLNGYWEIDKVVSPEGSIKKYRVNTTVDFIWIEGTQGYRKKVHPKLDGSYETSDDAESFLIIEKDGVFSMQYKNNLSEWKERIEKISTHSFTVINEENIAYHYRRFQPTRLPY